MLSMKESLEEKDTTFEELNSKLSELEKKLKSKDTETECMVTLLDR